MELSEFVSGADCGRRQVGRGRFDYHTHTECLSVLQDTLVDPSLMRGAVSAHPTRRLASWLTSHHPIPRYPSTLFTSSSWTSCSLPLPPNSRNSVPAPSSLRKPLPLLGAERPKLLCDQLDLDSVMMEPSLAVGGGVGQVGQPCRGGGGGGESAGVSERRAPRAGRGSGSPPAGLSKARMWMRR